MSVEMRTQLSSGPSHILNMSQCGTIVIQNLCVRKRNFQVPDTTVASPEKRRKQTRSYAKFSPRRLFGDASLI